MKINEILAKKIPNSSKRVDEADRPLTSAEYVQQQTGLSPEQYQRLKQNIGHIESRGKYDAVGGAKKAYTGKYQFGPAAIIDASAELGIRPPSRQELLSNPELQEKMQDALMARNIKYIASNPKDVRSAQKFQSMSPQERAQVIAMAHSGGHGAAKAYMHRGKESYDAFGTTGEKYRQAALSAFDSPESGFGDVVRTAGGDASISGFSPDVQPKDRVAGVDLSLDIPRYAGSAGSQELQKLNPNIIADVNKIYTGDVIQTPSGGSYTIQAGDTLDQIAKKLGVSGSKSDTAIAENRRQRRR